MMTMILVLTLMTFKERILFEITIVELLGYLQQYLTMKVTVIVLFGVRRILLGSATLMLEYHMSIEDYQEC